MTPTGRASRWRQCCVSNPTRLLNDLKSIDKMIGAGLAVTVGMTQTNTNLSTRSDLMPSAQHGRAWALVFALTVAASASVAMILDATLARAAGAQDATETQRAQTPPIPPGSSGPPPVASVAAPLATSNPLPTTGGAAAARPALPSKAAPGIVPRNAEHVMAFDLNGQTYVAIALASDGSADEVAKRLPKHGVPTFVGNDDYFQGAVAMLDSRHLPKDVTAWRDRDVHVGKACTANVTGFSLVTLASGDLDYLLGDDADRSKGEHLFAQGDLVIAGRLDGCKGVGGIARLASLPTATYGIVFEDQHLVERATHLLVHSTLSDKAQKAYVENGSTGLWWQSEEVYGPLVNSMVVRHPDTGDTFVSVHAVVDYGCGGANINLWGLYRATDSGILTEIHLQDAGSVIQLGHPIDLDRDGMFEFPASADFGDRVLLSSTGTVLQRLPMQFYGCGC